MVPNQDGSASVRCVGIEPDERARRDLRGVELEPWFPMRLLSTVFITAIVLLILDQVFLGGRYLDLASQMGRAAYHHIR